ncbi:CDGSH iron-sulfur domain-containing protein [Nocardia mangyaensis]|uniref:CDGSH iron-sulfur domain-containing protein n=1 Tax=Nocardia mangyaensis TaxID=2213200 RepID=UPI002676BD37|nr:CDGSH iron-sulfur domain-containing protein [Nocardia mangyaensis]MDO3646337.1 CDGSH iron-sulfur domain-containing protein [Nocardia mangyaensis]
MSSEPRAPSSSTPPDRKRIVFTDDGPALVDGPIDLVTADGTVLHCDRFQVALCLCRRSATYPLCDTSHRRRHRREPGSTDR